MSVSSFPPRPPVPPGATSAEEGGQLSSECLHLNRHTIPCHVPQRLMPCRLMHAPEFFNDKLNFMNPGLWQSIIDHAPQWRTVRKPIAVKGLRLRWLVSVRYYKLYYLFRHLFQQK